MSRLQPIGQKKLTNICVVRYKRCGKRFEVAAYRNTVLAWRNGSEKDIDEVLQAHTIFANLEQGDIAKSEDLIEAFGTDNEDVVCVEVLNKGEFQVSEEERQAQVEQLFKDVAARVTDMCVNPETQKPYPLSTIERYMRETMHFAPSTTKSAKQQALAIVRQLEQALHCGSFNPGGRGDRLHGIRGERVGIPHHAVDLQISVRTIQPVGSHLDAEAPHLPGVSGGEGSARDAASIWGFGPKT